MTAREQARADRDAVDVSAYPLTLDGINAAIDDGRPAVAVRNLAHRVAVALRLPSDADALAMAERLRR